MQSSYSVGETPVMNWFMRSVLMFIPASAADFTASDVILDATQPFQCFHNLPLSFNYSMQTLCLKVSYGNISSCILIFMIYYQMIIIS